VHEVNAVESIELIRPSTPDVSNGSPIPAQYDGAGDNRVGKDGKQCNKKGGDPHHDPGHRHGCLLYRGCLFAVDPVYGSAELLKPGLHRSFSRGDCRGQRCNGFRLGKECGEFEDLLRGAAELKSETLSTPAN
jgi:hypothetical protein